MPRPENGQDAGKRKYCGRRPQLFPPEDEKALKAVQHRELRIKTLTGYITVEAVYGQDRETGKWVMPMRERLGLQKHKPMTPALEDRLCHLAISTRSYEKAAEVANRQGIETDDTQIKRVVQQAGQRAREQAAQREAAALDPRKNREIARQAGDGRKGSRFVMALMMDGTMLRIRGKDWGMKPVSTLGERAIWHELKAGLVIRLSEASAGRRQELAKYYVATDGGPEELGRKLYAEALRRGLEQAERVYVIADGAVWIWNVAAEHFPGSLERLDFYHASEHVWDLSRVLWSDDKAAREWAVPLLSALKHRGGEELISALEALRRTAEKEQWSDEKREALNREASYFGKHASRLDYPEAKAHGVPLGSGAMESACNQIQGRFKRSGQFWSRSGEQNLLTLELAWRNWDWSSIWARSA